MKKTLLVILLLNLGVISMSHAAQPIIANDNSVNTLQLQQLKYGTNVIVIGSINTSITQTVNLKPDTAEFSVTYLTDGTSSNEASNRNAATMQKLHDFLQQLGIKDADLTTVGYQSYDEQKPRPVAEQQQRYNSTFTVNLNINNEQFFQVIKLLDQNNITNIQQNPDSKQYVFTIEESSDSADKAKQLAQEKYQAIIAKLHQLAITDISVAGYDNQVAAPQTELIKQYYVQNSIKIKVSNFDLIGKIIAKAQELNITVNNDFNYSVSESEKNRVLAQYEQTLYEQLAQKASRLLGQHYQLGLPTSLSSDENRHTYSVQPKNYGYSRAVFSSAQAASAVVDNVDIQPPAEYTITLTMLGSFEIVKTVAQP